MATLRHPIPAVFDFLHFLQARQVANATVSAVVKVLGSNHNGNIFYFQMPHHIHFFSGVTIELKMMVSGLNHLEELRRQTWSRVQRGRGTSPMLWEGKHGP